MIYTNEPPSARERLNFRMDSEILMEEKAMLPSKRQKQALLTMVSDRPKFSEMSEAQQRYARAKAKRILDEKARKKRAGSLKPVGE